MNLTKLFPYLPARDAIKRNGDRQFCQQERGHDLGATVERQLQPEMGRTEKNDVQYITGLVGTPERQYQILFRHGRLHLPV